MNTAITDTLANALPGTPTELGILIGRIRVADALYALYQPPKAIAERLAAEWTPGRDLVADALSFSDGYANTVAMAKAGSPVAQYALDNGMHIPSVDELDLQYRLFKPTADKNWCYMRSGINLSAETPLQPYTPEFPVQTALADFRDGGPEAFAPKVYWSSTQCRDWDVGAWAQDCEDGCQVSNRKGYAFPVRLVRRSVIR